MGFRRLKDKLHFHRPKGKEIPASASPGPSESKSGAAVSTIATEEPKDSNNENNDASSNLAIRDVPIRELWNVAYEKLREENKELLQRYEAELQRAHEVDSALSRQQQMDAILKQKIEEVERDSWKLKFANSEVPVKNLAEPVLGVISLANDYITGAVSGNPYASMAWSGVSLLLPVSRPWLCSRVGIGN